MKEKYKAILHLPHPVSSVHHPMPSSDRAAQFAPFAALTGFGGVITETARLTNDRPELSEDRKAELDRRLRYIKDHIGSMGDVKITHFVRDENKQGGALMTVRQRIKKTDEARRLVVMEDGTEIQIENITEIDFDGDELI